MTDLSARWSRQVARRRALDAVLFWACVAAVVLLWFVVVER